MSPPSIQSPRSLIHQIDIEYPEMAMTSTFTLYEPLVSYECYFRH